MPLCSGDIGFHRPLPSTAMVDNYTTDGVLYTVDYHYMSCHLKMTVVTIPTLLVISVESPLYLCTLM